MEAVFNEPSSKPREIVVGRARAATDAGAVASLRRVMVRASWPVGVSEVQRSADDRQESSADAPRRARLESVAAVTRKARLGERGEHTVFA
jgi:hypothetical protein